MHAPLLLTNIQHLSLLQGARCCVVCCMQCEAGDSSGSARHAQEGQPGGNVPGHYCTQVPGRTGDAGNTGARRCVSVHVHDICTSPV
jgi:hypothetical protein